MKRPALQNERVAALRMVFRARKVFGTFEKSRNFSGVFRVTLSLYLQNERVLRHETLPLFSFLFPLQHVKRSALQNKQVVILRMAFRARKVLGTFEKRAPEPSCSRHGSANQGSLPKKKSTGCDISQPMVSSNHASSNRPELKFTNSLLCISH